MLFLLVSAVSALVIIPNHPYSAVKEDESWTVVPGRHASSAAVAYYNRSCNETGWNTLTVITNANMTDKEQAYGAGFAEGVVSQLDIWNSWLNYANGTVYPASEQLISFITEQDKFVRLMVQENTAHAYWKHVGLTLDQFDGMFAGYAKVAPEDQQLSYTDSLLYMLNYEVSDIEIALSLQNQRESGEDASGLPLSARARAMLATKDDDWPNPGLSGHCSVLIKPSSDGQRLYAAHDMWWTYTAMLRTYKHYELNYNEHYTLAHSVSFSSYPGNLCSGDDFYITGQRLVVMETTNNVMNASLYANVTTDTVPYWIRIGVANRMSDSGPEWMKHFGMYNSGTYNNQWMVLDTKLFTPGQPLPANTLWVAEQIPGYFVNHDQTDYVTKHGYWSSYNVPFYPFIYNISLYPQYLAKYGDDYSWSECARAKIFRRDQGGVSDMDDMRRIMRYNEYQTDPLSQHDAGKAISARGDLNVPWLSQPYVPYGAFGGIDSKITEASMVHDRRAIAVSGPTWDAQPVFAWNEQWSQVPHFGHPTVFDFDYVETKPYDPSS